MNPRLAPLTPLTVLPLASRSAPSVGVLAGGAAGDGPVSGSGLYTGGGTPPVTGGGVVDGEPRSAPAPITPTRSSAAAPASSAGQRRRHPRRAAGPAVTAAPAVATARVLGTNTGAARLRRGASSAARAASISAVQVA